VSARPRILGLGLVAAILSAGGAGSAMANGRGCGAVHVGPSISIGGKPASYFQLTVNAGATAGAALVAANPQRYDCGVQVLPAYGKTATNSGDTYPVPGSAQACRSTDCWLSGVPARVSVPARRRLLVPFTVHVPPGTPAGQYLAGVVAAPDSPPVPTRVVSGHTVLSAAVVAHVAIGVAVRVPGPLTPALSIPSVRLDAQPEGAILHVSEQNSGNTWEHPVGTVTIMSKAGWATLAAAPGKQADPVTAPFPQTFSIRSNTVLPHDSATLPLSIGPIAHGTWPTEVHLWYDHHRKEAVWRGTISYPKPSPGEASGGATFISVPPPSTGLPVWAKFVIGALGGVSVALAAFVLFLLARRRRREA
jgi:hypothetical protein